MGEYDVSQMMETVRLTCPYVQGSVISTIVCMQCRKILKFTAVMMRPQNLSLVEPIRLFSVQLQPSEETGLVS